MISFKFELKYFETYYQINVLQLSFKNNRRYFVHSSIIVTFKLTRTQRLLLIVFLAASDVDETQQQEEEDKSINAKDESCEE